MTDDDHQKIEISPDLLWDLGYQSMTRPQVTDLLEELYETLELRVGIRLAEGLNSNQLQSFEKIVARRDESEALKWLQSNAPAYKQVVAFEWQSILRTLRRANQLKRPKEHAPGLSGMDGKNA